MPFLGGYVSLLEGILVAKWLIWSPKFNRSSMFPPPKTMSQNNVMYRVPNHLIQSSNQDCIVGIYCRMSSASPCFNSLLSWLIKTTQSVLFVWGSHFEYATSINSSTTPLNSIDKGLDIEDFNQFHRETRWMFNPPKMSSWRYLHIDPGGKILWILVTNPVNTSLTLLETNIAGWKIHHFDGIYQDFDEIFMANC